MKRVVSIVLSIVLLFSLAFVQEGTVASASGSKYVVIKSIKGNKMKYYDACNNYDLNPNVDWSFETTVGHGKLKTIKLKKTKFYYLKNPGDPVGGYKRVSKRTFCSSIHGVSWSTENGIKYCVGFSCAMTVSNGKCTKLKQLFMV